MSDASARYTQTQVLLHWLIAFLVAFQLLFAEYIEDLGEALGNAVEPALTTLLMGQAHIWVGVALLVLMVVRVAVRIKHGAPPEEHGAGLQVMAAKAAHVLFYAILFALPTTGIAAWFFGNEVAGNLHGLLETAMIGLIAVHVLAVVWHQFIKKDHILKRMLPDRQASNL